MRKLAFAVACLFIGWSVAAQDDAAPAAPDVPPAPVEDTEGVGKLDVEKELEQQRLQRQKQREEKKAEQRELEIKLAETQARQEQLQKEVTEAERVVKECKDKQEDVEQRYLRVSEEYSTARNTARDAHLVAEKQKLQGKWDAIYARELAAHNKDLQFIEDNKWRASDFDGLSLRMDDTNPSKRLVFDNNLGTAQGSVPTMNNMTGVKSWHVIPPGTKFSPTVQKSNPFVVDVSFPGKKNGREVTLGSTNVLDWDLHVHVAKEFDATKAASGRFVPVGIAWLVDVGRYTCYLVGVAPVFEPRAKPEKREVADTTPEIVDFMDKWKFEDPAWNERLESAKTDVKHSKEALVVAEKVLPRTKERAERTVSDLKKTEQELNDKIEAAKLVIKEYEEAELEEKAPKGGDEDQPKLEDENKGGEGTEPGSEGGASGEGDGAPPAGGPDDQATP